MERSDTGRDGDRASTARELLQLITGWSPGVSYVTPCPCFYCSVSIYLVWMTDRNKKWNISFKNNNDSTTQLRLLLFLKCFIYSITLFNQIFFPLIYLFTLWNSIAMTAPHRDWLKINAILLCLLPQSFGGKGLVFFEGFYILPDIYLSLIPFCGVKASSGFFFF